MINGKVWGETKLIFKNDNFEVHRIEVNARGFCSKHKHQFKHNIFYVEDGILEVRVWKNDYDLVDKTVLQMGDTMDIPPGEFHQFQAQTPATVYEIYYSEPISGDIIRESIGGK